MDLGTKKNFKGPSKLVRQPLFRKGQYVEFTLKIA